MLAERALITPKNPENEKSLLERSTGIDLTIIVISNLNFLGTLKSLPPQPNVLLSKLPSFIKFKSGNQLIGPKEETELFTRCFASTLSKSWTATDTENISEKEKDLVLHCAQLRNKGYDLKKVVQEVCKYFNLSLPDALEIAKKEYFTVDDLAQELEMNIGNTQNRVKETLKKDPTIRPERFGGRGGKLFIPESQRNKLKSIVGSFKERFIVTLPDNSTATINGTLKKKIFDMLLETFNQPHGLALDEILDLYSKDNPNAKVNANHAMAALKKELEKFGWTIENKHIRKGPGRKHSSEYFLKRYQVPEISPTISTEKKEEITIFEPKFDSRLYSTPKGEKPFLSLTDMARDLGAKESDVRKALARKGIKGLKNNSSQGGKKEEFKLSYPEYQIIRPSLQQEVKGRKKKPKRGFTFSSATVFQEDQGRF